MNNVQNPVKMEYLVGLCKLLAACNLAGVEIRSIHYKFGGFIVIFDGFDNADAILHNGSYENDQGKWETIGFPWDNGDVSVHNACTLAAMISALKDGGNWEIIEEGDEENE